jgi:nucleoside-diphosphate-sugar epimerase
MKPREDSGGILVTGGSGFIGRYLVKRLSETKETVVNLYHHRLPEPMPNVYPVCSDLSLSELLLAPLRGIDTVIHLAWHNSFINSPSEINWNLDRASLPTNARMTLNLIEAMERSGAKRIVFISAMGASRYAQSAFLREKYLAELLVTNSKIPEKIILRSSLVFGEGGASDRLIQSILHLMRLPGIYPVPCAKQKIAPIFVEDLVQSIAHFARSNITDKTVLCELAGTQEIQVDELFQLVAQKFMHGQRKLPVKGFIGNQLYPLVERERLKSVGSPRLRELLTISGKLNESIGQNNPLTNTMATQRHSLSEAFSRK